MNFRLYFSLPAVLLLTCFVASSCAKKEKAMVDLNIDEKVVEVKQDEIKIEDADGKIVYTAQQNSQTAPQKMTDNSEITVMLDGFGNKLEKRFFKTHPRLESVIIRTNASGQKQIFVYGQNGERSTVDGEMAGRLMNATADEIANAARIYGTRPLIRRREVLAENNQPQQVVMPPSTTMTTMPTAPVQQPAQVEETMVETQAPTTDATPVEQRAKEMQENIKLAAKSSDRSKNQEEK